MADHGDPFVVSRYPCKDFPAPIVAAVIDNDDLELGYHGITDFQQTPERYLDHMTLVVHRHHDSQLKGPGHPCSFNRHTISNFIDRLIHSHCEKSTLRGAPD